MLCLNQSLFTNSFAYPSYIMLKFISGLIFIYGLFLFPAYSQNRDNLRMVQARKNADDKEWKAYPAQTIDRLPNFKPNKKEPALSIYGGWKVNKQPATGFFRTAKVKDRWWIIDPEGYPFIHKGVAVFQMGSSERQQAALTQKYGTPEKWASTETQMLRAHGFNGLGSWSAVDLVRELEKPLPYTIIVSPMGAYKSVHQKKFGGKYLVTGWQGYRFDLIMVFDPEFKQYVEDAIKPIARYAQDKYLLGYYTDNELPWKNDALDRHLTYLAKDEPGYLAAKTKPLT